MKTLLTTILILFSVIVNGQHHENDTSFIIDKAGVYVLRGSTTNGGTMTIHAIPPKPTFNDKLIDLLVEYETDCFNDSVYRMVDVWHYSHSEGTEFSGGRFNVGYQTMELKWVHREPTFKGFIKWLKK